jgi:hypothetical protein
VVAAVDELKGELADAGRLTVELDRHIDRAIDGLLFRDLPAKLSCDDPLLAAFLSKQKSWKRKGRRQRGRQGRPPAVSLTRDDGTEMDFPDPAAEWFFGDVADYAGCPHQEQLRKLADANWHLDEAFPTAAERRKWARTQRPQVADYLKRQYGLTDEYLEATYGYRGEGAVAESGAGDGVAAAGPAGREAD